MVVFAGADEQQRDYSGGEEGTGDRPDAVGVEGCDQIGEELFVVLGERGEGRGEAEGCGHEGGEGRRIGRRGSCLEFLGFRSGWDGCGGSLYFCYGRCVVLRFMYTLGLLTEQNMRRVSNHPAAVRLRSDVVARATHV